MKEGIVDLSAKTKEEPWCSHCSGFTDYKRKWTAYQRADLNGGIYPENDDVPHCVSCGSMMHFFKFIQASGLGLPLYWKHNFCFNHPGVLFSF